MASLPLPSLQRVTAGSIPVITDAALADATGVTVAFTGQKGGVSKPPYASLNLGSHVGDVLGDVEENRRLLADSLGASGYDLLVPNQVHGTDICDVRTADPCALDAAREAVAQGADGIISRVPGVAALLCFADCVPVALSAPTGDFAVVHAGWRGAVGGIASKAARLLCEGGCSPDSLNVYIGPHIHGECFETGQEVAEKFVERYGEGCLVDANHVSLLEAVSLDLASCGVLRERIVDAGICTKCQSDDYYSYRASGGTCGRHGAIAFRR